MTISRAAALRSERCESCRPPTASSPRCQRRRRRACRSRSRRAPACAHGQIGVAHRLAPQAQRHVVDLLHDPPAHDLARVHRVVVAGPRGHRRRQRSTLPCRCRQQVLDDVSHTRPPRRIVVGADVEQDNQRRPVTVRRRQRSTRNPLSSVKAAGFFWQPAADSSASKQSARETWRVAVMEVMAPAIYRSSALCGPADRGDTPSARAYAHRPARTGGARAVPAPPATLASRQFMVGEGWGCALAVADRQSSWECWQAPAVGSGAPVVASRVPWPSGSVEAGPNDILHDDRTRRGPLFSAAAPWRHRTEATGRRATADAGCRRGRRCAVPRPRPDAGATWRGARSTTVWWVGRSPVQQEERHVVRRRQQLRSTRSFGSVQREAAAAEAVDHRKRRAGYLARLRVERRRPVVGPRPVLLGPRRRRPARDPGARHLSRGRQGHRLRPSANPGPDRLQSAGPRLRAQSRKRRSARRRSVHLRAPDIRSVSRNRLLGREPRRAFRQRGALSAGAGHGLADQERQHDRGVGRDLLTDAGHDQGERSLQAVPRTHGGRQTP